jgi:hypothetical protein
MRTISPAPTPTKSQSELLLVGNCFPPTASTLCEDEGTGEGGNEFGAAGFGGEGITTPEKVRETLNGDEV